MKFKERVKITPRLIAVSLIIFLALAFLLFKNQLLVANVNGQPIWRFSLIRELEKQSGKQVLDSIITKTLILQEAKKQNVVVTKEEINQGIEKIKANFAQQGQDLNQLLAAGGMSQKELEKQVEFQKIIEKIVGKDIQVSDDEVENYLKENESLLPKDTQTEELKESVKDQLKNQKISEQFEGWIKSLHDNAKINYLIRAF